VAIKPVKTFSRQLLVWSVCVVFWCASNAGAQPYLDAIGLKLLRGVTTNLNGNGIRVALIEAPLDATNYFFQPDPNLVGQPTNRFTFMSALGSATNYPNSIGGFSSHANGTATIICSPMHDGVATNIAHLDNIEANHFYDNFISVAGPNINDPVANQSYTFGALTVADQQLVDSQYDDYAVTNNTLFVSAVDNGGNVHAPGTAYNCIGVAAYSPGAGSSIGPTIDNGRCKPDLTAISGATSFSTPQVSGAAALLMQAGLRGDGGSSTNAAVDMRTVKALLLNGAVKPAGWTNGAATPLDARYGAGVLNVLNSYEQLIGGQHGSIISNLVTAGAAHPPMGDTGTVAVLSGWDFATNTSSAMADAVQHYYFNVSNNVASVKFTATATLVWNRQLNQADINNLALFLYHCANSNLVTCSTSLVDNVEHIYTTNLAQGRYDLQVWKAGGASIVSASEPYALAWEFVPPPALAISGGTNRALNWPVYPAGFLVEARTNLTSGAWSTNGIYPPALTNGLNSIPLNPTNAAQFFRLRKPNL
jgi:hypothetical protein